MRWRAFYEWPAEFIGPQLSADLSADNEQDALAHARNSFASLCDRHKTDWSWFLFFPLGFEVKENGPRFLYDPAKVMVKETKEPLLLVTVPLMPIETRINETMQLLRSVERTLFYSDSDCLYNDVTEGNKPPSGKR